MLNGLIFLFLAFGLDGVLSGQQASVDKQTDTSNVVYVQPAVDDINGTYTSYLTPEEESLKTSVVYFADDSYALSLEYMLLLDQQSEVFFKAGFSSVIINSHSDASSGTSDYNLAISERRANTILDYLISKGLNSQQITIVPYGSKSPLYYNPGQEKNLGNNRAIVILQ